MEDNNSLSPTKKKKPNKRQIYYNIQNTKGVSSPLIPFNCIFDIDVGLLKLICEQYANPEIFDRNFFVENCTNIAITHAAYTRETFNPLLLCMKDKSNTELADQLYIQFINEKYNEIILNSVYTGIYKMCKLFEYADDVTATILYSNEYEYRLLKNCELKNIRFATIDQIKSNNIKFNQCIFKSPLEDFYLKNLIDMIDHKMVYFLDYKYNFSEEEEGLIITNYLDQLIDQMNQICIINAYDKDILEYKGE